MGRGLNIANSLAYIRLSSLFTLSEFTSIGIVRLNSGITVIEPWWCMYSHAVIAPTFLVFTHDITNNTIHDNTTQLGKELWPRPGSLLDVGASLDSHSCLPPLRRRHYRRSSLFCHARSLALAYDVVLVECWIKSILIHGSGTDATAAGAQCVAVGIYPDGELLLGSTNHLREWIDGSMGATFYSFQNAVRILSIDWLIDKWAALLMISLLDYFVCSHLVYIYDSELVDTFFIVIHKKKLIFLHWYHHITVLLYCWHSYVTTSPPGIFFVVMNYGVHAM